MRALVCEAYGPIETLKIADVPVPEPKTGEVLLRVGAAGVPDRYAHQRVQCG